MTVFDIINLALFVALILCYSFQFIYIFIPFLKKMPPHICAAVFCVRACNCLDENIDKSMGV